MIPSRPGASRRAALGAGLVTFGLLAAVQLAVPRPMLLAERFFAGGGWLAAVLLALWAAFVATRLVDPTRVPRWRRGLWLGFGGAFFLQLLLGVTVDERFLMSGTLHLPVPAMILAGPLFRGEGLFMPVLLGATLVLLGPAWCSHLCYLGTFDQHAADRRDRPAPLPRWIWPLRLALTGLVALVALALRAAGIATGVAAAAGLAFGLVGLGVMAVGSTRLGLMVHCLAICPIGVVANLLGRLSPFRLAVAATCTRCGRCALACRMGALAPGDLARGRPGLTCTLCGDCVASCPSREIAWRWLGLSPDRAQLLFVILVASAHAVFLGVARI